MHEVYADREVMRYVGSGDSFSESIEDSERRLRRAIAHHERHGFGLWAVTSRETGMVMGDAGLFLFAGRGPEIELAYRFAKAHWGRGFATEAARAWLEYGFGELDLERIVAVTHEENPASRRVLEKIGMRPEGRKNYRGTDLLLFAIERDWKSSDTAAAGR
jgi:ribosomal-protein-alanine N-acetyltransferase